GRADEVRRRDQFAGLVVAVRVDARECADAARGGPRPRAFAIRDRDPLAALDERQCLAPGNHERVERPHCIAPCRVSTENGAPAALCQTVSCPLLTGRIISGTSVKTEVTPQENKACARCGSLTV